MAYSKEQAHDYYENYTKKGKKKGRAKGKGKKTTAKTQKLVGLSVAGLNDEGKMEFALMKEAMTNEMNAALKKATTPEETMSIRREYQQKALAEVQKIKNNPQYQKPKATKAAKSSSSSKSSKSSEGSKKSSKSSSSKSSSSQESTKSAEAEALDGIKNEIANLSTKIALITPEQMELVKETVNQILNKLGGLNGVDTKAITTMLERLSNGNRDSVG